MKDFDPKNLGNPKEEIRIQETENTLDLRRYQKDSSLTLLKGDFDPEKHLGFMRVAFNYFLVEFSTTLTLSLG